MSPPTRSIIRSALLVTTMLQLGSVTAAHAYVPARDGAGRPMQWDTRNIALSLYVSRKDPELTRISLAALQRAADTWSEASGIAFSIRVIDDKRGRVAEDGVNAIVLSTGNWCAGPARIEKGCREEPSHGLTHPYSRASAKDPSRAEIIEADIEVNASSIAGSGQAAEALLEAILLHELGHLLGLDHVCRATRLNDVRDHRGGPVPRCSDGPESALATVMYPDPLHERYGRQLRLGHDEQLAVRDLYQEGRAGFATGTARIVFVAGCALSALSLFLVWRRQRRRRPC